MRQRYLTVLSLATLRLYLKHRIFCAIGGCRPLSRHLEAVVEVRKEAFQHAIGVVDRARTCKSEFADEPVLERSRGTFHSPLGLRRKSEDQLYPKLVHSSRELGGSSGSLRRRRVLEDGVPVRIERERYATTPYQSIEEREVAAGVLQLTEQGIDYDPAGVVHCQQQRELRSFYAKPSVVAAVYLYQHTLTRHPLTTNSVLQRPTPTGAVHTGVSQYPA